MDTTFCEAKGVAGAGDTALLPDPEQLRQAIDLHERRAGLLRRVLRATLDVLAEGRQTEQPAAEPH